MTYLLVVFPLVCSIPCYPITESDMPITWEAARTAKEVIEKAHLMETNTKVYVICRRNDG